MKNTEKGHSRYIIAIVLPILLLFVFLYWLVGTQTNVYKNVIVSAIFEILWLPVVLITLALPIFSIIHWARDRWKINSIFLVITILSIGLILWMVLQ
jgi:hypothetical protein